MMRTTLQKRVDLATKIVIGISVLLIGIAVTKIVIDISVLLIGIAVIGNIVTSLLFDKDQNKPRATNITKHSVVVTVRSEAGDSRQVQIQVPEDAVVTYDGKVLEHEKN